MYVVCTPLCILIQMDLFLPQPLLSDSLPYPSICTVPNIIPEYLSQDDGWTGNEPRRFSPTCWILAVITSSAVPNWYLDSQVPVKSFPSVNAKLLHWTKRQKIRIHLSFCMHIPPSICLSDMKYAHYYLLIVNLFFTDFLSMSGYAL